MIFNQLSKKAIGDIRQFFFITDSKGTKKDRYNQRNPD